MSQVQLSVALVMIALFTVAIIGFAINFASDNDSSINIANDAEISSIYNSTSGDTGTFKEESQSQYQSIIETTLATGSDSPSSVGSFAVTPANLIRTTTNILKVGYTKIFGSGSGFGIFLTALLSIITFLMALFIYKTFKGMPD